MANELAVRETGGELQSAQINAIALAQEFSVAEVVERVKKVRQLYKDVMQEGTHYGNVPGTEKPTIFQAGIDLLSMMFKLDAEFETEITREGDHREVKSHCTVFHIPSSVRVASAESICSTRESRYAWRKATRKCPVCSKENIRRSNKPDRSGDTGWYCWKQTDGCGANFQSDDPQIVKQEVGRVPNPDLPDTYNTVLKIANKRSKATGILNATAATEVFTVDMEDFVGHEDLTGKARTEAGEEEPAPNPTSPAEKPAERVSGATAAISESKAEPKKAATRPAKDTPVETTAKTVTEPAKAVPASGKPTDVVSAEERAWFENECKETGAIMTMLLKQKNRESPAQITIADMNFYKQVLAKRREKMTAGN